MRIPLRFAALLALPALSSHLPAAPQAGEEVKPPVSVQTEASSRTTLENGTRFDGAEAPEALQFFLRNSNYDILRLNSIDTEFGIHSTPTFGPRFPPLAIALQGPDNRAWTKLHFPDGPIEAEALLRGIARQSHLGFYETPHLWVVGEPGRTVDVRIRNLPLIDLLSVVSLSAGLGIEIEGMEVRCLEPTK